MQIVLKILKWLLVFVLLVVVGIGAWLFVAPPALIRIAAGYSAKIVCSNVFIANRDPEKVLSIDVQAPGNPVLKLLSVDVERNQGVVHSRLLGMFGRGLAIYRRGTGCTVVPDGDVKQASAFTAPQAGAPTGPGPWPQGAGITASDPAVTSILADTTLTGPGMRGVVVVKDGHIVGETYSAHFGPDVPLLGWSMTKTVNAAIIGTVIADGRMKRDEQALFPFWQDERAKIGLPDMMAMASGLEFNEDYGDVTDVTRMLYVEPDMASFAAHKPLIHPIGQEFNYSSGTAVMLSRVWQDAIGDQNAALAWPRTHLFDPIGMTSAVMETDARGTFVGSSYMYATARDWARFGLFLLRDGNWNGRQILPEGYVEWMRTPSPAYEGYGRQVWMEGPQGPAGDEHPDAKFGVPDDAYWMIGHDGQSLAIIPSAKMVVVRLGLTPSKLGYQPQPLVAALIKALRSD